MTSRAQARQRDHLPYYVYRLRDPETLLVRYIGISKDPYRRFTEHMAGGKMWRWFTQAESKPMLEVVSGPLSWIVATSWENRLVFLFHVMRPGQLFNQRTKLRQELITERHLGCLATVLCFRSNTATANLPRSRPSLKRHTALIVS